MRRAKRIRQGEYREKEKEEKDEKEKKGSRRIGKEAKEYGRKEKGGEVRRNNGTCINMKRKSGD